MIRMSYMALHALILLAACTSQPSGSTEGKEAPKIPGITKVGPDTKIKDIKSDPFTMSEATIDGGVIKIKVSYSGGRKDHDFALYWNGSMKKSNPPQADIYLKHDAHGDMAEAMIMKTLEFDLAEMSKPMVITVHTDHGDKGKVTYGKQEKTKEENAETPEAYVGKLLDNDSLELLAEHRVIATFKGVKFRTCWGDTGDCPDKCGSSGNFANFKITDYLHYKKLGKYGDDKEKAYSIQISDFHRKPQGDPALLATIEALEKGDKVLIEWKHLYGQIQPGMHSPVRPLLLLLLKKIDRDQR